MVYERNIIFRVNTERLILNITQQALTLKSD